MSKIAINKKSHFELCAPHILYSSVIGMLFLHFSCYHPHLVPDQYLGPIGQLHRYMAYENSMVIQYVYHIVLVIHVIEAIITIFLTKSKGITDFSARFKWFLQTVFCAFLSLRLLLAYKPKD